MKGLVFHAPKDVRVENVPDPKIEHPRDAIIRVTSTAICGTDLHIYHGLFPVNPTVLGHEFMGIVEEVGQGVTRLQKGDRVIVPFSVACGQCFFCTHQLAEHCETSNPDNYGPQGETLKGKAGGLYGQGKLYGNYNGGQAEYVRVPFADFGLHLAPEELTDEQLLFLTDIFPTGWSAIDWAKLEGNETVVVFGCGPVGIMTQKAAWLHGAKRVIALDVLPYRLEMAKCITGAEIIDASKGNPVDAIREMTSGRGADVCVDAVGMEPERNLLDRMQSVVNLEKGSIKVLRMAVDATRRGGKVVIIGMYGTPYDNFPIHQMFDKKLTMFTGLASIHEYMEPLLRLVREGKVRLDDIITHKMPLSDAAYGYQIFGGKEDRCMKVILKP